MIYWIALALLPITFIITFIVNDDFREYVVCIGGVGLLIIFLVFSFLWGLQGLGIIR